MDRRKRETIGGFDDMSPEIIDALGVTPKERAEEKLKVQASEAEARKKFLDDGVDEFRFAREEPKPSCVDSSAKPVAKTPNEKTASAGSGAGGR
jgi:hypothetical protein